MNISEKFVAKLCKGSFLSFWSYPTPIRKDNKKELCDLLVINDPYIIIFSVKDVDIPKSKDSQVDINRWFGKAIKSSVKQIYGAEHTLNRKTEILGQKHEKIIPIPELTNAIILRITVALGRSNRFPLISGDFGKGFIHTFDEISFPIITQELDTITDFVEYLQKKEDFHTSKKQLIMDAEENLLAFYLENGRNFPDNLDILIINSDMWNQFATKKEYKVKKSEDKQSYVWDRIIEEVYEDCKKDLLYHNSNLEQTEKVLRVMSKENRFSRRILSNVFLDFIGFFDKPKGEGRFIKAPSGIIYVFMLAPHDDNDRERRMEELGLRCFVARTINPDSKIVIGIATNPYEKGGGHSYDLFYFELLKLTQEFKEYVQKIQQEFGYFRNAEVSTKKIAEYPEFE